MPLIDEIGTYSQPPPSGLAIYHDGSTDPAETVLPRCVSTAGRQVDQCLDHAARASTPHVDYLKLTNQIGRPTIGPSLARAGPPYDVNRP
ncbi:MAG: hypothetical protein LQ348_003441 [Seirophora lacunosa]|nr:MAG: hypothetical protein LQ348_003441 [Seirophora lacunosa]